MAELSEKSFPFDSDEVGGKHDRSYLADDFARYFRAFISSGVFMKQSTNLQVIANGDMTVKLMPGSMMIDGYRYDVESEIIIAIDPADGVTNRIDRISATWSKADRDIHYTLQKGTPSYEPIPPVCRRTADCRDYVVADIYVGAGVISIKQADITDQRLNSEVCGLAVAFSEIDTTTIFLQFAEWFKQVSDQGEIDIADLIDKLKQDSQEKYDIYLNDLRAFYADIVSQGQQKYDSFNADITAYIEELEDRGETNLAAITKQLLDFRNTHESEFLKWLERMQDKLREYPPGEFQIELDRLKAKQEDMMEMLLTGMVYTKLATDDSNYIVDDKGKPILVGNPICTCNKS